MMALILSIATWTLLAVSMIICCTSVYQCEQVPKYSSVR
jgi:hypothetical protein